MAQTLLVGPEIETGRKILQTLDDAKLRIGVAMWAVLSSYGDWRLVLSSGRLDLKGTRGAYHAVLETLDKAGFTTRETESLVIFSMKDKFVRDLRQAFAVAQVDEDDAAVVAAGVNPARQSDGLADVFFAEDVAEVGAIHGNLREIANC